jgi:LmbE family N-acetylglucosaminyl deacetylase
LITRIHQAVERCGADILLVFDEGGITGHPDHCRATEAAVAAARELELPVLAWVLPERVASALNAEFGAGFIGRSDSELDFLVSVDRARQRRAISQHVSQATDNPVLRRRLELQGDQEAFRWLLAPY